MKGKIGIIGSGVMGTGVAQLFAQCGYQVMLVDTIKSQLNKAKDKIVERLHYQKIIGTRGLNDSTENILLRINFTTSYNDLEATSFIIENVTENWSIKRDLYTSLNNICSSQCILGVNTSAISITKIASLMENPKRVVGMHFMNPATMMPMVEVIKGYHTDDNTIESVKQLLGNVQRKYIVVNDSVGFVTNRAMMIFVNEAIFMVQENIASAEDIDALFRQCFGHKMGPLQTADLIGLDTILNSLEVLYEGLNDSKYRPCWLLKKMVDAGLHGEKTKKGFYSYE
jgi:3-hydroxybutyryl-CoA dehydrogenase